MEYVENYGIVQVLLFVVGSSKRIKRKGSTILTNH